MGDFIDDVLTKKNKDFNKGQQIFFHFYVMQ